VRIVHDLLLLLLYCLLSHAFSPRHFCPWPTVTPSPIFQVSDRSTFRIMCDVPSVAIVCSESLECFPGMASKIFFILFVSIPVAPLTTRIVTQFMFQLLSLLLPLLLTGQSGDRIPVEARCSAPVQRGSGAQLASYTLRTVSFLGVKRPVCGVDQTPIS